MAEKDLVENAGSFLRSAKRVYADGDFTSAAILFFKALFVILDIIILRELGKTPKDHSERFQILKSRFPDIYTALDKLYPTYRDTYTLRIEKEACDRIRKNVESIAEKHKILA